MGDYTFSEIRPTDRQSLGEMNRLLAAEGIRCDSNLDYIVGLYDRDYNLVATGSCYANTLRCLAVDHTHQGEGLLNRVVSHLEEYQMRIGNTHLFLYTKPDKAPFFNDLGFYEIARQNDLVIFMENKRDGFASYLRQLQTWKREGVSAALVMNCNPFTLGHRYLAEYAASRNDNVHLFVVSEDASVFPFADRYSLVKEGCADLKNVFLHSSGSYMISRAVFPSYFLKDSESAIEAQASLDLMLFRRIAELVGATRRYIGEEPFSKMTGIYNRVMLENLLAYGIECIVIPRMEVGGRPISASHVRQLIHDGRLEEIRPLVPQSTYDYFFTEAGKRVIEEIKRASSVVHY